MYEKIVSEFDSAITSAVGKSLNNFGVTWLIRLSVHCADNITATINSNGLVYCNSVSATGTFVLK